MKSARELYQQAINKNRIEIEKCIEAATAKGKVKLLCCEILKENVEYFRQLGFSITYDPTFDNYDITWRN